MTRRFDTRANAILVQETIAGPTREATVTLALDTGSTFSVINPDVLLDVGVEIEHGEGAPIATASGVVKPRRASVTSLAALGHIQNEMVVLAHPLARELRIDGLLGLDFLRGRSISIDFRVGTIDLD